MNLPKTLRRLMKEKSVTQVQLAGFFGLAQQSSMKTRLNSTNPTIETLTQTLNVLGYELVMQPKRQGRRPEGQIVLDGVHREED